MLRPSNQNPRKRPRSRSDHSAQEVQTLQSILSGTSPKPKVCDSLAETIGEIAAQDGGIWPGRWAATTVGGQITGELPLVKPDDRFRDQ